MSTPATTPDKKIITDLAELRSAIRKAKKILVFVWGHSDGPLLGIIHITRKEALRCAIEDDKFDDYAAEWDNFGGGELLLNHQLVDGQRAVRRSFRNAQVYSRATAARATYLKNSLPVPEWIERQIARTAPPLPVLEHGVSTHAA